MITAKLSENTNAEIKVKLHDKKMSDMAIDQL